MPFDSLTLNAVSREIRLGLQGERVNAVHQPEPLTVVLTFSRKQRLLLCADAEQARVHLVLKEPPRPATPPPFCMLLRKYLEGARLREVRQPRFDRVLELEFAGGEEHTTLIAEIMGRHSNLLLREEDGILKGVIKPVPASVNRYRELRAGTPYVPPPDGGRLDPLAGEAADAVRKVWEMAGGRPLKEALPAAWIGMSPVLVAWLLENASLTPDSAASPEVVAPLEQALNRLRGIVEQGSFQPSVRLVGSRPADCWPLPFPGTAGDGAPAGGMSQVLEGAYAGRVAARDLEATRSRAAAALKTVLGREERKRQDFERAQREAGEAVRWREWAQALLSFSADVPEQAREVTLPSLEADGKAIEVPLDPELSAVENAERYFKRARSAERAGRRVAELAPDTARRIAALTVSRERASAASTADEVRQALQQLPPEIQADPAMAAIVGLPAGKRATTREPRPDSGSSLPPGVRRVLSASGHEILYGRSSTDNDFLTTRVARPNDWWFHVRGESSAHVIIRTQNQPDRVPQETILEAANVAAIHSASKHSSYVPVDYTLRKYVVKRRGSPAGAVEYRQEKTLHVQPKLA